VTSEALLLGAALAGYLVGSISFARVVGRLLLPGQDLSAATLQFDARGALEVERVSATSVSVRARRRWGLLVSLLDIAKAAVITAVFRWIAPDQPAYLAAVASGSRP
jgi:glycerol-3-phosphate acyltransferase PlsY